MLILNIDQKEENKVIELLEKNSIKYEKAYNHFFKFCDEEAEFRLFNMEILDKELQDKINNLADEQKQLIINKISSAYKNDDILDYEYMSDLLEEEVRVFLKELEIEGAD